MDWKQLLAYISGSVDEELLLRIEYLVAENRILRDQIKGRIQLTDAQRKTLATSCTSFLTICDWNGKTSPAVLESHSEPEGRICDKTARC